MYIIYICTFHIIYKITNILCVCPFTSPTFLTNSCVLKKIEGRSSLKYCRFSHNNSARELMIGRRTHFFTSIPYASDQLSSTCHVTLHGGFNCQAARVTRNSFTCALLFLFHWFLLRFNTGKLFSLSLTRNSFYTFMNMRDRFVSSYLWVIYLLYWIFKNN